MLPYEVLEIWWFCITFLYFRAATLWGYGLGSAPAPSQVNVSWISSSTTSSCSSVLCGNKMWWNTSQAAPAGPSHLSLCKRQLFTSILEKPLKCEVSTSDTEVSGWVVNSLTTFFPEQQTVQCSAGWYRWWQGCFRDQHLLPKMAKKEGTPLQGIVWAFLGWVLPVLWEINPWQTIIMVDTCGHEHVQAFNKIHMGVPGCILLQQHSVFTK